MKELDWGLAAVLIRMTLYFVCFMLFAYCALTVFRCFRLFSITYLALIGALGMSAFVTYFPAVLGTNPVQTQAALGLLLVPPLLLHVAALIWTARQANTEIGRYDVDDSGK